MKLSGILILVSLFSFSLQVKAQNKQVVSDTFRVDGNCNMCKERIESAVDVKGVLNADWNKTTKMLTIQYRTDKINIEKIHYLLNQAGHDTSLSKAPQEAYDKLHGCCNYRSNEDHE